tara:strand:+ start:1266 stop:2270 length:1005 start_codon:yes stop_codon:yes gene_type:complete
MNQNNHLLAKFIKIMFFSIILTATSSVKAEPNVVTTIKPLHSLIANVMEGIGEPSLIVEGSTSPHSFILKPSHAKLLENADIIFWVGKDIETFMEKPLESIVKNAKIISFIEMDNIKKLKFREENIFDDHNKHEEHDKHEEHEEHDKHEEHEEHDKHEEHEVHDHAHGEFDAHIWLDPINAKEMVHEIAHELSDLDPVNKKKYNENAKKTIIAIDHLIENVDQTINKNARFVVFHDAYQYFEKRFGISSYGSLTLNPDVLPGAKQISDIQNLILTNNINCIFSEPQFNPKIIETIALDTNINTGVLDPLGAYIKSEKPLYFILINNLSEMLKNC